MVSLLRLQTYLYDKEHDPYYNIAIVPPFAVFLHASKTNETSNYAITIQKTEGDLIKEMRDLAIHFLAHERSPAMRYLDGLNPTFKETLEAQGYRQREKRSLLVCTPDTFIRPVIDERLDMVHLSLQSSLSEVKEALDTEARSKDSHATLATESEAFEYRTSLVAKRAFSVRIDGQGVAAVMYDVIRDRITEIRGVSTMSKYRGQGIATAATAHATSVAFDNGAEAVFVQIQDTQVANLFRRLGFRHTSNAYLYVK